MDNVLILSRSRVDSFKPENVFGFALLARLDFYGIREPDGTITPIKNRYSGSTAPLTQLEFNKLVAGG